MKTTIKSIVAAALCAVGLAAFAEAHTHTDADGNTVTFKPIADLAELKDLFANGGSGYLTTDIDADAALAVAKDVNLCLNDKVLNLKQKGQIDTDAAFCLYDCGNTKRYYDKADSGLWTLKASGESAYFTVGGVITGGKDTNGGGVWVSNGCSFSMYGGNISGNMSTGKGGGVFVNGGTFKMYGGNISGNMSTGKGGGVYVISGTFKMEGGVITENTATTYGGGIEINGGGKCYFTAAAGKTVSITGNTAKEAEAGVANWGELHLSGKVIVKDNICTATYDDGINYPVNLATKNALHIDGDLTGSEIYLTHTSSSSDKHDTGVLTDGYSKYAANVFSCDGPYVMVKNAAGELGVPAVVAVVEVALPTTTGYGFVVSNLTAGAEAEIQPTVAGGTTYKLPVGDKVGIYAVPEKGYVVTGEPYIIDEVKTDTTIDPSKLPGAEPPAPSASAESEAFAFDVREEIALAEGAVTVAGVSYSDTAWGAADPADVTLCYTNVGSHATGELKTGLSGEGATEVELPKKDGDYRLTHSTGKLTSFVKFTVSGYPLGSEGNPWEIGANAAADVIAFSNGTDTVFFDPVRGTVTKAGLETITNAMGGASFPAKLIADGSETNDLVMVLGASGTAYDTIADALAADEASYTLFDVAGVPYLDWDDVEKKMTNAMCVVFETYTGQTKLEAGKTYAVMGVVTNKATITVNGTVESPTRLILCDGAKLTTTRGVKVQANGATTNALVICAQSEGDSAGALEATGGSSAAAGIGAVGNYAGGIVTINGGTVTATGGSSAAGIGGAGIYAGGIVTVNGGTVTATGGSSVAGIGGGFGATDSGTVTFGADKTFVVLAGKNAAGAAYVTQTAYTNDHTAYYVTLKPGCALKIPAATTGYTYAVTNTTTAKSVPETLVSGTNVYAFATNDSYEVTYALDYGYEWATAPKANPLTGTITADTALAEVKAKAQTYTVHYDGGWGSNGSMADDTFTMFVPTNLTANAYTIVGYRFDGWSKDGTTVAYTNRQEGVDFAQPGETLVLTALWEHVGVEPTDYNDLAAKLPQVTRPVTFDLVRDIEIPAGGKIEVPAGKSVTFNGIGDFDVTAEHPALFCGYPVGTGLKPEDLGRFKTDKDVKAYFEDGKVVVRGRGETEEFPWLLGTAGHEDEVTAWAGDGMILTKPTRGTASVAAFQSVTNALSGYVPGLGELKVISADGTATNNVVMLLGSDGVPYDTLADVLAADPMPETVRLFEVKGANVEFNAMGGVHADGREIVTNFCVVTYELPDVERKGYTFKGWYVGWKPDAAEVTNGQDLVTFEPHALYAQWTAKNPTPKAGELDVPDVKNGQPVTTIEAGAYNGNASLSTVVTPLYLNSIGMYAFQGCSSLKTLTITAARSYDDLSPVPVTVAQNAFSGCSSLETVYVAAEIDKLGKSAFQSCAKLKKIVFQGDGTITYGSSAFYRCGYQNGTGSLKVYMSRAFQENNAALIADFKKWNTQVEIIEKVDVMPVNGIGEIAGIDLGSMSADRRVAVLVKTSVLGTPDPDDVDIEHTTELNGTWSPLKDGTEKTANPDGTVLIEIKVPEVPQGFFRAKVTE